MQEARKRVGGKVRKKERKKDMQGIMLESKKGSKQERKLK